MKKAHLARKLSEIKDFEQPKVSLEQYLTPPQLAADIIYNAYMQGDIEGKKVADLGTGTGILAIGAALMGGEVIAVEKDAEALEIARENAERLDVEIDFRQQDVSDFDEDIDTVVMNPPFSVHSDEGFVFLEKAFELSDAVYTVSNSSAEQRIKDFAGKSKHEIQAVQEYRIALPPTYGFHTEESRETPVNVVITRRTK